MRGKQLHAHTSGSQSFAIKRDIFVGQSNFLTQYMHVDTYTTNILNCCDQEMKHFDMPQCLISELHVYYR